MHPDTHTLYLAGPMRGYPRFNFAAFDAARNALRAAGFAVICPAEMDREAGFDPDTDEASAEFVTAAARRDLGAISRVDAIVVLPGFTSSRGCRVELTAARWAGIPVHYFHGAWSDGSIDLEDVTDGVDLWLANAIAAPTFRPHRIGGNIPKADAVVVDEHASVCVLERTETAQQAYRRIVGDIDGNLAVEAIPSVEVELVDPVPLRLVTATDPGDDILDRIDDALGEVRVVDPETGGEKGRKLARFDLLPAGPLWQVAEHFGRGAAKYTDRNWERGYAWSLSYGALLRHLLAWWAGEDHDAETGSHHLAAVAFHTLALLEYTDTHPEKDDRPR